MAPLERACCDGLDTTRPSLLFDMLFIKFFITHGRFRSGGYLRDSCAWEVTSSNLASVRYFC